MAIRNRPDWFQVPIADRDSKNRPRCLDKETRSDDPVVQRQIEEVFAGYSTEPVLLVDGIDHTQVFVRCVNQTGYDEMASWAAKYDNDPAADVRQVDANNRWTSCAREHGWPMIKDSSLPAAGKLVQPVLLPPTITEEQLRALLTACPNFDPVQAQKLSDWYAKNPTAMDGPQDTIPNPDIDIDADAPGEFDVDHLIRLTNIIQEQSDAFYRAQSEGTTPR